MPSIDDGQTGPERIEVWVPGVPAPKGSTTWYGKGQVVDSSKKLPAWMKAMKTEFAALHVDVPFDPPVSVSADFYLPAPARSKFTGPWGRGSGDTDKLMRAVGDALEQSGLITDDSQIARWRAEKHWTITEPGARIVVMRMNPVEYFPDVPPLTRNAAQNGLTPQERPNAHREDSKPV